MANTRFKTHHGILATSNSRVEGDLVVTGNLNVTGTFAAGAQQVGDFNPQTDQFSLGNTSNRWNLSGFNANLAGTLVANGATTLSNTITVTGAATFQNTATVGGAANLQGTLLVAGQANLSSNVGVAGSITVTGQLAASGNTALTNSLITVNTNSGTNANTVTVGAANVSMDAGVLFVDAVNNRVGINNTAPGVALRVTGAVDISTTANVQGNTSLGGGLSVAGNTTVNNASVTGNLSLSTATVVTGNANFTSGVLFVDSVNNRVGVNNTAPGVALRVTGAVDISTTANVQGAANVGGNLGVAGTLSLSNATTTHTISGNVAFDTTTLVVDSINNRVGVATAAPAAALDVTGDIRSSANLSGTNINGTNFVSNSTGIYHTGTVNAASLATSRVLANTTGVYPSSNNAALGNTTARWDVFASALNLAGVIVTGNNTSNVVTGNTFVSANSIVQTLTGTVTVTAGSTGIVGSGTSFTTQVVVGDVLRFSSCNDIHYTVTARTSDTALTVLPMPDANVAGSGLTVEKKRIATLSINGLTLFGNNQLILPSSTEANSSIGNTSARWNVYGIVGDFSSNVVVAGGMSVTGSTNTLTDFRVGTVGTSNGFLANSTTITVGNSTVNTTITPSSFSAAQLSATQGFTSGTIGVSSGFSANSTTVDIGTSTANTKITSSGINVQGGSVNASVGFYVNSISASSNGVVITSGIISIGNTSVNAQITPLRWNIGGIEANSIGMTFTGTGQNISPISNTAMSTLGTTTARWGTVYAQDIVLSNSITVSDLNISGTANASIFKSGTIGALSGFLANSSSITIGTSTGNVVIDSSGVDVYGGSIILTTGGVYSGSIGTGQGSAMTNNTITVGNSTVNTVITQNGMTAVNVNVSTLNTGSVIANTSGLYPTSNGGALGSATQRWALQSATINTSGEANVASLRINSTLTANGSTGSAGQILTSDGAGNTYWSSVAAATANIDISAATTTQAYLMLSTITSGNTDTVLAASNVVANSTGLYPVANDVSLGAASQRWALTATSGNFSGPVTIVDSLSFSGTLSANGSTGTSGFVLTSKGGTSNAVWAAVPASSITVTTAGTGTRPIAQLANASGTTSTIYANNSLYANGGILYGTELVASSDMNLKEDILTIQDGLDTICGMRGVSFTFKDTKTKSVGLIAQEVEELIPEVVSTNDVTGMKHVNYGAIVGVLIEAIKELKQEINELKYGNKG